MTAGAWGRLDRLNTRVTSPRRGTPDDGGGVVPSAPEFADLYRAAFSALCVQLYAHTGDLAEAQDVVQEAFCRAYVRWPTIRAYDDPVAWVRKVAWNLATSRWRRVRRAAALVQFRRQEAIPPPEPDHVDLTKALAQLPSQQRQVLVLHYIVGVTVAEMAEITGVAEGTVK